MVPLIESTKESVRQERETSATLSRTVSKLLSAKNIQCITNLHSFKSVEQFTNNNLTHKGTFTAILWNSFSLCTFLNYFLHFQLTTLHSNKVFSSF